MSTLDKGFVHSALSAGHAGVFAWHVQARRLELSSGLTSLFGFPPDGFDGRMDTFLDILYPPDRDRILDAVRALPADRVTLDSEFRLIAHAGNFRWFYAQGAVSRDANDCVESITGFIQELPASVVSERRMRAQQAALYQLLATERIDRLPLQQALEKITARAAKTLEVARVSVWRFDGHSQTLTCETLHDTRTDAPVHCPPLLATDYPSYFAALSESRALAVSYAPTDFRTRELNTGYLQPQGIASMLEAPIRRGGVTIGVVCHEHIGPMRNWTLDEQNFAGSVADLVSLILETGARSALLDEIRRQAEYDPLTNLPNRTALKKLLAQQINSEDMLAIAIFDLDQFKEINDTLGHEMGDELLHEVARRLSGHLPKGAQLFRTSGDEFAMLWPDYGNDAQLLEQLRHMQLSLRQSLVIRDLPLIVSASVGASRYPADGKDVSNLLRHADIALHHAKQASGSALYQDSKDRHSPRRLALLHDLVGAVEQGGINVFYQPIYDIASRKMIGVEALARWTHPEYGPVRPDEFIALAELSGLIQPLTQQVLTRACQDWKIWKSAGQDLRFAVNLSPNLLSAESCVACALGILAEHGIPAERLEFEITESAFFNDPNTACKHIKHLRAHGVHFSLDDFGVGFSSFSHLANLPLNTLKIDKSFVQKINTSSSHLAIVHSAIQLGFNLDLHVIAEGVEDFATLDTLQRLGCPSVQGFLLGVPMPAAAIPTYLPPSL
jgi:diguanylate cyclase (GGDEF)-like protein